MCTRIRKTKIAQYKAKTISCIFLAFAHIQKHIIACGWTCNALVENKTWDSESSTCFHLIIRHGSHALLGCERQESTRKSKGVVISLDLVEMIQINPHGRARSLELHLSHLPSKHCWNVTQHFQSSRLTSACLPARSKFETGRCHQCRCSAWLVQMTCTQRQRACRWTRNGNQVRCEQDQKIKMAYQQLDVHRKCHKMNSMMSEVKIQMLLYFWISNIVKILLLKTYLRFIHYCAETILSHQG